MRRKPSSLIPHLASLALVLCTSACSWLTDFRQQPAVGTWGSTTVDWSDTTTPSRGSPQGSVPVTGTAVAEYQVSHARTYAAVDSLASVRNPVSATQASVDRGWKYFQVTCAVCHGVAGDGRGLAVPFGVFAPGLTMPPATTRSDGYLWGKIRNGGPNMPSLNRIPENDRWHVVNYLRGLQGRLSSDIVVRREAVALPGVTGDALPGVEALTSERPRFVKPTYTPTPIGPAKADTGRGGHQ